MFCLKTSHTKGVTTAGVVEVVEKLIVLGIKQFTEEVTTSG